MDSLDYWSVVEKMKSVEDGHREVMRRWNAFLKDIGWYEDYTGPDNYDSEAWSSTVADVIRMTGIAKSVSSEIDDEIIEAATEARLMINPIEMTHLYRHYSCAYRIARYNLRTIIRAIPKDIEDVTYEMLLKSYLSKHGLFRFHDLFDCEEQVHSIAEYLLEERVQCKMIAREQQPTKIKAGEARGVALYDAALFFADGDDLAAVREVKRWSDCTTPNPPTLGKCPLDGRKRLSELQEVMHFVETVVGIDPAEKLRLRDFLRGRLRFPV